MLIVLRGKQRRFFFVDQVTLSALAYVSREEDGVEVETSMVGLCVE